MTDGDGHTITDPAGGKTNANPGGFDVAGVEAFGYTTSDSTLSGSADRFANSSAQWAALTTATAEVSYQGSIAASDTIVRRRPGRVSTGTEPGAYATTVILHRRTCLLSATLADDDDLYAELVGPVFPQPIGGVGGAGDAAS